MEISCYRIEEVGFVFWTDPSEKNAEDAGGVDELSYTSSSARRRALPVQPTGKSTRGGFPTHRTEYELQVPIIFHDLQNLTAATLPTCVVAKILGLATFLFSNF